MIIPRSIRMLMLILVFSLLLNPGGLLAQRVKPSEIGATIDTSKQTVLCAVLDEGQMEYSYGEYSVILSEAARNVSIQKNRYGTEGTKKRYFFEPDFRIKKANGKPLINLQSYSSGKVLLEIIIEPVFPPKALLLDYIRHNGNPDVMDGNVNPLCVIEYDVNHPQAKAPFVVNTPGGFTLNQEIVGKLQFDAARGKKVYEELMNGGSIEFSYRKVIKLTEAHTCQVIYGDIIESEAYRDLVSPVEGNLIWALQAYLLSSIVRSQVSTKCINEGPRDPFNDKILENYMKLVFKEAAMPFEDASAKLVNLDGSRFQTDILRRVAIDAGNLSRDEWCKKYRTEFEDSMKDFEEKDKTGTGRAGFSFLGIKFGGGGGGSTKTRNEYLEKIRQLLNTEDCGKNLVQNSFHYKFDGEKYEPKGIIAYETSSLDRDVSRNYLVEDWTITQDFLVTTRQIR